MFKEVSNFILMNMNGWASCPDPPRLTQAQQCVHFCLTVYNYAECYLDYDNSSE